MQSSKQDTTNSITTTNRTAAGCQFLEALPMFYRASKQARFTNAYLLMIRLAYASLAASGAHLNTCLRPIHAWRM